MSGIGVIIFLVYLGGALAYHKCLFEEGPYNSELTEYRRKVSILSVTWPTWCLMTFVMAICFALCLVSFIVGGFVMAFVLACVMVIQMVGDLFDRDFEFLACDDKEERHERMDRFLDTSWKAVVSCMTGFDDRFVGKPRNRVGNMFMVIYTAVVLLIALSFVGGN